jgi:hypothetical protein
MRINYDHCTVPEFFARISHEEAARRLAWRLKFGGVDFKCAKCEGTAFYQHLARAEIRECKSCATRVRLRVGTIFENSKVSMLNWVRAIFLVMQGKRGISALEIQKQLRLGSYRTAWFMLHRIRKGLQERDDQYLLSGVIEFDGAVFGKKSTKTEVEVLVAVETKSWVDEKGKEKACAGFAKIMVSPERGEDAQKFVSKSIKPDSMVNTDGSPALYNVQGVDADYRIMNSTQTELNAWLPWVHRFISNAKAWVIGTHHGVKPKYLNRYLSEYAYRFNRRHDPESLFYRTLTTCCNTKPLKLRALCA